MCPASAKSSEHGRCASSPTAPILIEQFNGHRMFEPPNHLNGTLGLETHELCWAKEGERSGGSIHVLARASEEEHRVSSFLMVDKVLPGLARLACPSLGFPMQQFSADR